MRQEEILSRLRLIRTHQIGPATYYHLLEEYGDAQSALHAIERNKISSKKKFIPPKASDIIAELKILEKMGAELIFHDQSQYPSLLRNAPLAPISLCTLGNTKLLKKEAIAIVGARNASHIGLRMAEKLTKELSQAGYIIVSGMARGIDSVAHRQSVEGRTIAVLAGGVDQVYPRENASLYEKIIEQGLVVSEMPLGTEPQARLFPRRNRIIAGLCRLTIVIESSLKSGSGITARFAADYGREVAAVPGSPLDTRNLGTLSMIRDGAHIITSSDDVIAILDSLDQRTMKEPTPTPLIREYSKSELPSIKQKIIEYLGVEACPLPDMLVDIPAEHNALIAALAEMEMDDIIIRHWDNRVQLSDSVSEFPL